MSRFFATGYNSDSSSEEEDLLSSSEEELLSSTEDELADSSDDSQFANDSDDDELDESDDDHPSGPSYFLKKSFLKGRGDDSDDESSGRRVVKSAKEKQLDEMRGTVDAIASARRLGDWTTVLNEFDKLNRQLIRAQQQKSTVPNFYIKCLAETEDYVVETTANEKEASKKMNAALSRAFNTIKQRLRKSIKEFQQYIDLFRDQPDLFDTEQSLDEYIKPLISDSQVEGGSDNQESQRSLSPVFFALKQIAETRGKKNVDRLEQIQQLEELLTTVKDETSKSFETISLYLMLLSIRFDASSNYAFMPVDQWKKAESDVNDLLDLLNKIISSYQVSERGIVTDEIDIEPSVNENGVKVLFGSITSLIERLDDEFTRSLQNADPYSLEYVERLKDESNIYKLLVRGQLYLEQTTQKEIRFSSEAEPLVRIVSRRFEHVYYKPDQLIKANESEAWDNINDDSDIITKDATPAQLVAGLSEYLEKQQFAVFQKKALLFSVYYYAVNNKYTEAKDLFLNSQYYKLINSADLLLQVMYNRALVQLGLCAFRSGNIEELHQALTEIANTQRLKELLGQGFSTKYPNQATTAEKQKLLPFHMHINLELFECVYMTGTFLLEIPALAAASDVSKDLKRKLLIKLFKSKLEFYDKQYFTGPPESIKDHVVHASKALQKGDWAKAYSLLSLIKIWKLFPDNESLLAMMKQQLQVEGLRTYIFTYRLIFRKLLVAKLLTLFLLEALNVIEVVIKMVEVDELVAQFDESKQFIDFTTEERQRTRLQELAIVMNEKVKLVTEKNEKTAANGHGRKQPQSQQKEQKEQQQQEENNRFRYASVNTNNDEFQS